MPGTFIEKSQVASIAGGLLRKTGATASQLVKAIAVFKSDLATRPVTPLPDRKILELPAEQAKALGMLARISASLPVPLKRRALNETEMAQYIEAREAFLLAKKALERFDENTKAVLHNHFDAKVEANGSIDDSTPFHAKNGWLCVEDKSSGAAGGEKNKITRELSGGGPSFGESHLAAMRDDGVITEREYQSLTRIPRYRELNDDAVIAKVAADSEFAARVLEYSTEIAPTPSIQLRPAK